MKEREQEGEEERTWGGKCFKLWGLIGGILITVKREVLVAGGFLCCPHIISGGLVMEQVII